jgi:hypothetical protein
MDMCKKDIAWFTRTNHFKILHVNTIVVGATVDIDASHNIIRCVQEVSLTEMFYPLYKSEQG